MNSYIQEVCASIWMLAPLIGMPIESKPSKTAAAEQPTFTLAPLPYDQNALEPSISATTIGFHYNKHHQTYVDNLNRLIAGTPWATGFNLETIMLKSAGTPEKTEIFNNAAQVWNHDFFWKSMKHGGGGNPPGPLMDLIKSSFGGLDEFKKAFVAAAASQFGSGWTWLVQDGESLKIVKTSNADNPFVHGQTVLLTCDVWEHAYYLDYQNRRKDFVQAFLDNLANWDFATSQLK